MPQHNDQSILVSVNVERASANLPGVLVKHREPTDSTAKELYATALRCAFPDCDEPLYRVITGKVRTLNSRVAHICARSEGGPRWDADMSEDENRSAENLVLLCVPHSYEVDDKGLESRYPVPLLREWKATQIDEYDRAVAEAGSDEGVGYRLTDQEAAEVIRVSETTTNIAMSANVIQIGGSGGSLGGGGGGGGVVGSGTLIGGSGGTGGNPATEIQQIIVGGQSGKFPGAGGGGGGVLLPGTVSPPPRAGVEGRGYIAGIDGAPGGDTTFGVEGKVYLRAEGGKGGLAGSGIRVTSDRLAVSTILVANYVAPMPHGLVTIVDAGWHNFSVLNVPTPFNFPVFSVIEAGGAPAGEYTLMFEVRDPSGDVRTGVSVALVVERPGDLVRIPFCIVLSADIDAFGIWQFVVRSELAVLGALDLMIKRTGEAD